MFAISEISVSHDNNVDTGLIKKNAAVKAVNALKQSNNIFVFMIPTLLIALSFFKANLINNSQVCILKTALTICTKTWANAKKAKCLAPRALAIITKEISPNSDAEELPKKMILEFLSIFFVSLSPTTLFNSEIKIWTGNVCSV